ncbi:MAG: glycosyltransferase family 4 protein [Kiritimatiellia bacterium]
MRILLANKFHYPRGGDCIHSMELERLLKAAGHEVAFFAMDCPQNEPSPWQPYFPSEVAFSPRRPGKMLKGLVRPIHAPEVKRKFHRLLDDFRPDVVHLHNIHTQLSPVIARIAKERGLRVVWTLHDYKLLCPRYDGLRDGKPCELCFGGDKSSVLRHSCLKGSRLASAVAYLEARKWNRAKLEAWTDAFICPSQFMKSKMEAGGFAPDKLHVLHNFIDARKLAGAATVPENHYCYVGRLSAEKGVRTLVQAAGPLPYRLKVVGTGPLETELQASCARFPHVEFLGHRNWAELRPILAAARFLVVPSEWYENNPLSIIEALALGVPVLGANIGGIPKLVVPGRTGELFEPGNAEDLRRQIERMWTASVRPDAAAQAEAFSATRYLERLLPLYGDRP